MMRRFLLIVLMISMILTLIIAWNSIVFADDNSVSQKEAQSTALYYINLFSQKSMPQWKDAGTNSPILYYSVDMTPAAYEFTVIKDNKPAGYIFISARKDWMPVLEFSHNQAPSTRLSSARTIAVNKSLINQTDQSNPVFYYGGALEYNVQIGEKMKNEKNP